MSFSVVATLFSNFCPYLGLNLNRKSQTFLFYLQRFRRFPLTHLGQLFKVLKKFKFFWCCNICPSSFQQHVAQAVKRFWPIWNKDYSTTVLRTEVNFLADRVQVHLRHSDVTVSSLRLDTQHTHYSVHAACVQKTCMLKRWSYKRVAGKNVLYCNKKDGENVGHIIRNLNGEIPDCTKLVIISGWSYYLWS